MSTTNPALKIGVFLPLIQAEGASDITRWSELKTMATLAEDIGFDSLWIPDHLIFRFPEKEQQGVWEAMSVLAALAAVTKRVEIGPLVLCSGWRNPALLAKMADTIDEISGGRLILGIGAGWHKPEFDSFGFPFDHRYTRFAEAVTIIHGLLRDGSIDFDGTYYQARECELRPRGPRRNGPPILIGTTGEKMLRLTARYADMWNSDWRNKASILPPFLADVDAACDAEGRARESLERTVGVQINLLGSTRGANAEPDAKPLSGSPEEIAAEILAMAKLGVTHLQLLFDPNTPQALETFAPILEMIKRG